MSVLTLLIILAVIFNGTLGGASLDGALVKLPARKRIGARAYAVFARGNDLGNGLWVYPSWAIVAALLVLAAAIVSLAGGSTPALRAALLAAAGASVLHFIATSRAAPVMLSIRNAPDDEQLLAERLNRFAFWHAFRAFFQLLTFLILIWALLLARLPE